ncbi:MAG TPA: ribosomal-processing cysteine protease Prp [Pseudothermotoga sp.]
MIKITFCKLSEHYLSFVAHGHSHFDVKGKDIVCAAVSSLVQHTARILHDRCEAVVKKSHGKLEVSLREPSELSDILIDELYKSLYDLQEQFSSNLSVEVNEDANRYTNVRS